MPKVFDLIVFDWDGTLMDSEAHIINSMQCAFDDVGMESVTDGSVRNIIGLGMREAVERLLPGINNDTYESIVDRYRYHFFGIDTKSGRFDIDTKKFDAHYSKKGDEYTLEVDIDNDGIYDFVANGDASFMKKNQVWKVTGKVLKLWLKSKFGKRKK